jgi:chromosome partitioning protein
MTGLSLALANLKPGTGKTTSAVWLAHVFARAGNSVLLVDADPSGSALEWSDLAAIDPRITPQEAFPFRIVALPSRELHRRLPDIARDDDVVIIDTPQIEDHAAIARSALRYADEIVIPCAPTPIEINRTTPVRDEIAEVGEMRVAPVRSAILLNRCVARAHSTADARQALDGLGYQVLATAVPRLEVYAQSFGLPVRQTGLDVWRQVARDLIARCAPPCPVRSLPRVHKLAQAGQKHSRASPSLTDRSPGGLARWRSRWTFQNAARNDLAGWTLADAKVRPEAC